MDEKEARLLKRFITSQYRFKNKLKINKKDADLLERIKKFCDECRRITLSTYDEDDIHGISYDFTWEEQIGFCYTVHTVGVFALLYEKDSNKNFNDYLNELKVQASIIKRRRKDLAKLIRLKNRLKLPGPVSHGMFTADENFKHCIVFHEHTQEEIDEILKH